MTRSAAVVATVCVLGLAAVASARWGAFADSPAAPPHRGPAVELSGDVENLYPGRGTRLQVLAINRRARPVRLLSLSARVGAPDAAACTPALLRIRRAVPDRVIAAHGRIRVRLRIRLSALAPDPCQGAAWPLRYHARLARRSVGRR